MPKSKHLSSIRQALALNLRRLRAEKLLSQEVLADMSGLHRTYVGSVERGERNISVDNIQRLANALSVSASELLEIPIDATRTPKMGGAK